MSAPDEPSEAASRGAYIAAVDVTRARIFGMLEWRYRNVTKVECKVSPEYGTTTFKLWTGCSHVLRFVISDERMAIEPIPWNHFAGSGCIERNCYCIQRPGDEQ